MRLLNNHFENVVEIEIFSNCTNKTSHNIVSRIVLSLKLRANEGRNCVVTLFPRVSFKGELDSPLQFLSEEIGFVEEQHDRSFFKMFWVGDHVENGQSVIETIRGFVFKTELIKLQEQQTMRASPWRPWKSNFSNFFHFKATATTKKRNSVGALRQPCASTHLDIHQSLSNNQSPSLEDDQRPPRWVATSTVLVSSSRFRVQFGRQFGKPIRQAKREKKNW